MTALPQPSLLREPQGQTFRRELLEPQAARKSIFASAWFFWLCFLTLTGVGTFLRFWRLDYEAYWTDEAHTVQRINGNWTTLLAQIKDQGSPPGFYVVIRWWLLLGDYYYNAVQQADGHWIRHMYDDIVHQRYIANGKAYTAGYLRLLPAFFGSLTVPAMYFLGRQFTHRRGALLVMLLTAVNPFLVYYSRDIKMYALLGFFSALSTALLLKWLTSQRHLIWFPLYVASAFCLCSMHAMAMVVIGLHALMVLTRPRPRPFDAPLWVLSAALATWLYGYWYVSVVGLDRVESHMEGAGLAWITRYTDMKSDVLLGLPTVHMLGYLWPSYPPDPRLVSWFELGADFNSHIATRSSSLILRWEYIAAWALFAVLIVGLVPWERLWRKPAASVERQNSATRGRFWWILVWAIIPPLLLAATWLPMDDPWRFVLLGHGRQPLWEPRYLTEIVPAWLLWLGIALMRLPTLPLRTVGILFFTTICTLSSLSNHLIYRNPPYHHADMIALRYMDQKRRTTTAVGGPVTAYPYPAHDVSTSSLRKVVPDSAEDDRISGANIWSSLGSEAACRSWLQSQLLARGSSVDTIVLTDRYGDMTKETDLISDAAVEKMIAQAVRNGVKWKLVYEENYRWYYEWRFYIFHTWRTRVWQLESVTRPVNPDP